MLALITLPPFTPLTLVFLQCPILNVELCTVQKNVVGPGSAVLPINTHTCTHTHTHTDTGWIVHSDHGDLEFEDPIKGSAIPHSF